MKTAYNFNIQTATYEGDKIMIDTFALYGHWEKPNGEEGAGLWFEYTTTGHLDLLDYDGCFALPKRVCDALRSVGVIVDKTCEQ